jgi:hypothetical protein
MVKAVQKKTEMGDDKGAIRVGAFPCEVTHLPFYRDNPTPRSHTTSLPTDRRMVRDEDHEQEGRDQTEDDKRVLHGAGDARTGPACVSMQRALRFPRSGTRTHRIDPLGPPSFEFAHRVRPPQPPHHPAPAPRCGLRRVVTPPPPLSPGVCIA